MLVGGGHVVGGHVGGDVIQVLDVLLEGVADGAAVAGKPLPGLLALVLHEALEGLALAPLLVGRVQGLGGDGLLQAGLLAPDGPHRLPGRHQLGVAVKLLLVGAAVLELVHQGRGAVHGAGHILLRRGRGDVIQLQHVVPEHLLRLAAVALEDGALQAVGVLLHIRVLHIWIELVEKCHLG